MWQPDTFPTAALASIFPLGRYPGARSLGVRNGLPHSLPPLDRATRRWHAEGSGSPCPRIPLVSGRRLPTSPGEPANPMFLKNDVCIGSQTFDSGCGDVGPGASAPGRLPLSVVPWALALRVRPLECGLSTVGPVLRPLSCGHRCFHMAASAGSRHSGRCAAVFCTSTSLYNFVDTRPR